MTHSISPELYSDASQALGIEVVIQQLVVEDGPDSMYLKAQSNGNITNFTAQYNQYSHWSRALMRARHIAHSVSAMYDPRYWETNVGALPIAFGEVADASEASVAQRLVRTIAWTRVHDDVAPKASPPVEGRALLSDRDTIRHEYAQVLGELGAEYTIWDYRLASGSWKSVVTAMLQQEVRVGFEGEAA